MDYEICDDPFDNRCVRARYLYMLGTHEPEGVKPLMEKIRGKEEDMIHNYTPEEEFVLINHQIKSSQGFDVDFSMFRCAFNIYPAFLDETDKADEPEIDRVYFGRLAKEAIARYNLEEGTSFEFVEVEKANIYMNSGDIFFITFLVKDPCDDNGKTKTFQAKVINEFCREIHHKFCRPKPGQ